MLGYPSRRLAFPRIIGNAGQMKLMLAVLIEMMRKYFE
jgi:hypothetical protein